MAKTQAKKEQSNTSTSAQLIADTAKDLLERVVNAGVTPRYMGLCIVQTPGSWTRIGPTWFADGIGWLCAGMGVANWCTSNGLGQLATDKSVRPRFHAGASTWSPLPNLVFAVAYGPEVHKEVADLVEALTDNGVLK